MLGSQAGSSGSSRSRARIALAPLIAWGAACGDGGRAEGSRPAALDAGELPARGSASPPPMAAASVAAPAGQTASAGVHAGGGGASAGTASSSAGHASGDDAGEPHELGGAVGSMPAAGSGKAGASARDESRCLAGIADYKARGPFQVDMKQ